MQASSVQILKSDAQEEKCEMARMSLFIGAVAIGDLVKSTLGPKGMDKILIKGGRNDEVCITNDGAKILSSIGVDNPSARILIDVAKTQDKEIGDGTTSVVVFASELLKEAEKLIFMGIHPQSIISAWNKCVLTCENSLKNMSFDCLEAEPKLYEKHLKNLAKVTLSSKVVSQHMSKFVDLTVNAIMRIKETCHLESINILKKLGGCLQDSYLDDGFILDKKIGLNQPKVLHNARILLANTSMDADKVKVFGSRVKVDSTSKVAEIELMEKQKMKNKVNKILAHNVNCFINRQLIYNYPEQLFSDAGVMAIEHADFEGIERLAAVLGGEIVSTFDDPSNARLGKCDLIKEIMIGEDKVLKFSGVPVGEACTIVIRGASNQILDEAERSIHDALCILSTVIKDSRIIYGGGASEIKMAMDVINLASCTEGKESIAMNAFANALKQLPIAVADNAGLDSCDLIPRICAAYASNPKCSAGIDINNSSIGDMASCGIIESFKAKLQVVQSAYEAATMILRVDEIVKAAPRSRAPKDHHC